MIFCKEQLLQRVASDFTTSNEQRVKSYASTIDNKTKFNTQIIFTKNFLRKNEKNSIPGLELNAIRDNKIFLKTIKHLLSD